MKMFLAMIAAAASPPQETARAIGGPDHYVNPDAALGAGNFQGTAAHDGAIGERGSTCNTS